MKYSLITILVFNTIVFQHPYMGSFCTHLIIGLPCYQLFGAVLTLLPSRKAHSDTTREENQSLVTVSWNNYVQSSLTKRACPLSYATDVEKHLHPS